MNSYIWIHIWIHINYEFIWFFHIWIHMFHEFTYEFGCTKVPDGCEAPWHHQQSGAMWGCIILHICYISMHFIFKFLFFHAYTVTWTWIYNLRKRIGCSVYFASHAVLTKIYIFRRVSCHKPCIGTRKASVAAQESLDTTIWTFFFLCMLRMQCIKIVHLQLKVTIQIRGLSRWQQFRAWPTSSAGTPVSRAVWTRIFELTGQGYHQPRRGAAAGLSAEPSQRSSTLGQGTHCRCPIRASSLLPRIRANSLPWFRIKASRSWYCSTGRW